MTIAHLYAYLITTNFFSDAEIEEQSNIIESSGLFRFTSRSEISDLLECMKYPGTILRGANHAYAIEFLLAGREVNSSYHHSGIGWIGDKLRHYKRVNTKKELEMTIPLIVTCRDVFNGVSLNEAISSVLSGKSLMSVRDNLGILRRGAMTPWKTNALRRICVSLIHSMYPAMYEGPPVSEINRAWEVRSACVCLQSGVMKYLPYDKLSEFNVFFEDYDKVCSKNSMDLCDLPFNKTVLDKYVHVSVVGKNSLDTGFIAKNNIPALNTLLNSPPQKSASSLDR